jgi:hypothetical protein
MGLYLLVHIVVKREQEDTSDRILGLSISLAGLLQVNFPALSINLI